MKKDEFEKLLTGLQKSNPEHDIIPVLEEMGYTALACEYLKLALNETGPVEPKTISIDALHRKKDNLYSKRAVLSNKFHTSNSNEERAEISHAIGTIQTMIIDVRQQIDEYFSSGKLPDVKKKSIIPVDGRRRANKLHSVRSSISYFRAKKLKETDPEKIKYYEACIEEHLATASELSA